MMSIIYSANLVENTELYSLFWIKQLNDVRPNLSEKPKGI